MGTKTREVVGADVDRIIEDLNSVLADEWLAYYQYWVGARIAKGPLRGLVAAELAEHAMEELEHADMLAERIIQLGGTPILHPKEWFEKTNCGYDTPENPTTKVLLEQNISGERCAIEGYLKMMKKVKDSDPVTWQLLLEILKVEEEHEEDLQGILEDMKVMQEGLLAKV